jgi:carboxymethylenebutenolidase
MTKDMNEQNLPRSATRRDVLGAGVAGLTATAAAALIANLPAHAQGTPPAKTAAPAPKAVATKPAGSEITYRSGDTDMKAFLVDPGDDKPTAAIIVIHEIWGLNDHIRDVARRFAQQGYMALAPDLFTREGPPRLDTSNPQGMMDFIASIPDRRVTTDLENGIAFLKGRGAARVGSVGFCMGGLYSYLLAAKSDNLAAAVDFYGRIVYSETNANKPESPVDLAPQLKCPLLGNFGETDTGITAAHVELLRERLRTSPLPWKINVYPGAGHAFFNDTRPSYHKEAAADAWSEMLNFFKKNLLATGNW